MKMIEDMYELFFLFFLGCISHGAGIGLITEMDCTEQEVTFLPRYPKTAARWVFLCMKGYLSLLLDFPDID